MRLADCSSSARHAAERCIDCVGRRIVRFSKISDLCVVSRIAIKSIGLSKFSSLAKARNYLKQRARTKNVRFVRSHNSTLFDVRKRRYGSASLIALCHEGRAPSKIFHCTK